MDWVKPVILWWNKNKKSVLKIFLLCAGLAVLCLLVLMFSGPLISKYVFCTSAVSLDNRLGVELSGIPESTPYQVTFHFPQGETQSVSCVFGSEDRKNGCEKSGAFIHMPIEAHAPEKFSLTVLINEKQISKTFRPLYLKSRPIGSKCPVTSYNETVHLTIPDDFFGE